MVEGCLVDKENRRKQKGYQLSGDDKQQNDGQRKMKLLLEEARLWSEAMDILTKDEMSELSNQLAQPLMQRYMSEQRGEQYLFQKNGETWDFKPTVSLENREKIVEAIATHRSWWHKSVLVLCVGVDMHTMQQLNLVIGQLSYPDSAEPGDKTPTRRRHEAV